MRAARGRCAPPAARARRPKPALAAGGTRAPRRRDVHPPSAVL